MAHPAHRGVADKEKAYQRLKGIGMNQFALENLRIDLNIGDGITFTTDVNGVARRFFVSRETLGTTERTMLTDNHDMLASFDRQANKIKQAIAKSLKLGASTSITFLTSPLFD